MFKAVAIDMIGIEVSNNNCITSKINLRGHVGQHFPGSGGMGFAQGV